MYVYKDASGGFSSTDMLILFLRLLLLFEGRC